MAGKGDKDTRTPDFKKRDQEHDRIFKKGKYAVSGQNMTFTKNYQLRTTNYEQSN